MKKSKIKIRNLTLLLLTITLASCQPKSKVKVGSLSDSAGGSSKVTSSVEGASVRVKNYNQYNMTLQKMTGINRSNHLEIFESIKGSLPSDNLISGMTPFNLVAMSRLADAYCTEYVNQKMPAALFGPGQEDDLTEYLMNAFLDKAPEDRPGYYSSLRAELGNVYSNDDGTGNKLFPTPNPNAIQASKDYTVAACVVILASPYVTLLE